MAAGAAIDSVVAACPTCGRKNRVPFSRLAEQATCGSCGAKLNVLAAPVELESEAQFDSLVSSSPIPVLVDFWAPWCGPCRVVTPELVKVAASSAGRLVVAKVNTDSLPGPGRRFQIASIPTMAVFKGGKEVGRTSGARPARDIVRWAESFA